MIHSLMATVVVVDDGGRAEFFEVLPILFGDCFEFVCIFFSPAAASEATEAEYGVIVR